jgi:hypothetical protein
VLDTPAFTGSTSNAILEDRDPSTGTRAGKAMAQRLLADLATLTQVRIKCAAGARTGGAEQPATPTEPQRRAFELLGVSARL